MSIQGYHAFEVSGTAVTVGEEPGICCRYIDRCQVFLGLGA